MKKNNTISEVQISYAPTSNKKLKVTSSADAEKCCRDIWNKDVSYKESMYVLLLNRANTVLGFNLLSTGGTSSTVVDVKVLFQLLVKSNAHAFILAHNHPSGSLKASTEDKRLTTKVKEAAVLFDMKLLDHIILTSENYLSMSDEGLI
jgi:DNA repair protein RadC